MKQTKVTDIAIKPSAEGIIASMEAQLKNPKSNKNGTAHLKENRELVKMHWQIIIIKDQI